VKTVEPCDVIPSREDGEESGLTQVSIKELKQIHAATHPSAYLERSTRNDDEK
jgi:hypothetical protein